MIFSLKFKKTVYLKNFALDFVLLVLKLYPIQVVISLSLWTKFTMGQLLLFFLCNFSSFFRQFHAKSPFFAVSTYALYGHPKNFNFMRKYQQYGPCFQTIFHFLMTMVRLMAKQSLLGTLRKRGVIAREIIKDDVNQQRTLVN